MDVQQFLHMVGAVRREMQLARRLYEDRVAPGFSLFDFIEVDEPRVSAIIAWLLNPEGSHGQHRRFLDLFMARLGIRWAAPEDANVTVQAEKVIPQGRLDICITTRAGLVALENKIGAADGWNQLSRYVAYLQGTGRDYRLIYLNPSGLDPAEDSMTPALRQAEAEAGRLHVWSYGGDLLPWLQQCRSACAADKVRLFIADFESLIQKTVLGVQNVAEMNPLVDMLTRNAEMTASAMQVIIAGPSLRLALLDRLAEQVRGHAEASTWKISANWSTDRELSIDFREAWPCWFTIGFEQTGWKMLYYGIKLKPGRSQFALETVIRRFGRGKSDDTWPWYRFGTADNAHLPYEGNWEASERPWLAIVSGEMAEQVLQLAAAMEAALAESLSPAEANPPS